MKTPDGRPPRHHGPASSAGPTARATLLFPPGTQGELVLPDGSTQPLRTLNVRATEYTVGERGPQAMPAELPPASAYTYAVELSADEAMAAGASEVRFDQPLIIYVENFLSFPVGGIVPVGFYDRARGVWIPSDNGRIIRVLGHSGGLAELDTDGDGAADDGAALSALGITDAERAQLAELYLPGQSLWRVPIAHFTPCDYNWPFYWPEDARTPEQPEPEESDNPLDDSCEEGGSVIECQNQTLGEAVDVAGTPFRLHYQSDRVHGRQAANTLDISLSGASMPASLQRIDLEVEVAGRRFSGSFPAAPNQRHTFQWDGRDAYDRTLQGTQPITVRLGYVYDALYQLPAESAQSFALAGASRMPLSGSGARQALFQWQEWQSTIGSSSSWHARGQRLGGWTLSVHHAYDPVGRVLYQGDGRRRSAKAQGQVISTVAGNGSRGFSGDGGPAVEARLKDPEGLALGPDGSLYIADLQNDRIRWVGPDGIITTVAGSRYGYSGDGGPAIQARFRYPRGIAVGPDGSLYIADSGNHRVRRVGPDGIITTVAGNGAPGYQGDGGLATEAQLYGPYGIAVGSDGSLYIADDWNSRIRRVGADGIITTVAGNGIEADGGDEGPAVIAQLDDPSGVAVGPDGNLYIADRGNRRIRRMAPPFPGFTFGEFFFPSEDGSEVYVLDSGRHLRTLNALTGAVHYQFTYDGRGLLVAITDGDGNVTTIERDAQGNPIALVAPFGQRTTLSLDGDGYLSSIANPAGEVTRFSYTEGGLLATLTDPKGNVHRFIYDALGRLTRDEDPAGGFKALSRAHDEDGYTVALTTALGRKTTYRVEELPTGEQRRVNTSPSGTKTEVLIDPNGTRTTTLPDGTVTVRTDGPEPRFGMQSPLTSLQTTTPGGLTSTLTISRSVTLADPDDPLSLLSQTDRITRNGRAFTSTFDAGTGVTTLTTPAGRQAPTIQNEQGRAVETQRPGLEPIRYSYDQKGRLATITQGSRTSVMSYDALGNLASITDPLSRSTSFAYDAVGRVTKQTLLDDREILYTYDANGNVTSITPPGSPRPRLYLHASRPGGRVYSA